MFFSSLQLSIRAVSLLGSWVFFFFRSCDSIWVGFTVSHPRHCGCVTGEPTWPSWQRVAQRSLGRATGDWCKFGGTINLRSLSGVIFGWIDHEGLSPLDYRQFLVFSWSFWGLPVYFGGGDLSPAAVHGGAVQAAQTTRRFLAVEKRHVIQPSLLLFCNFAWAHVLCAGAVWLDVWIQDGGIGCLNFTS